MDSREKGELGASGLSGGLVGPLGSDVGTFIIILSLLFSALACSF